MLGIFVPATAASQATGRLAGRAVEAESGRPLKGASVAVQGTSLLATTDAAGRFVLARVPAGPYTVTLSYIGRETQAQQVTVGAGATASAEFSAPVSAVLLEGLTVLGARAMVQAEALNRQKNAANIMNIVASDQMGRFPDASAPEAVQRLPGIAIARDQGEGRYIQIRGGSAANTQVNFNGVQVPSPEGEVRQIALDAVPVDVLESIEVSKAVLPDMDADAIGGAVNLVTRKAPAARLLSVEASGGFAPIRDDPSGSGALTYGDRPGDGRFGFLLNGSYSRRNFGSDDVEPVYDLGDPGAGDDALEELEVRHYTLWRERLGATANLDYRFSETSFLALTGIYSNLTDEEQRRNLVSVLEDEALEFRHKNRHEELRTYSAALGGEHLLRGGQKLDFNLAFTRSLEDTPYDTEIVFVREDVSFSPNLSDPDNITSNPSTGALEGPFLFDEVEPASSDTRNTDRVAALNFALPYQLGGGATGSVKLGFKLRDKKKTQDVRESAFELDDDNDLILGDDVGSPFTRSLHNPANYRLPPASTSPEDVASFVDRFGSRLDGEDSIEDDTNDYELTERVAGGYVMTELNVTPQLMILPGVRYEHTDVESQGFEWDSEEETLTPTTGDKSYGKIFPMLHVRYALGPRTNVRGAFTTTLARPNFIDLVPFRLRDGEDLVLGNPDLEPTIARSFDVLFEHYDARIGVLSAGAFYKTLTDPIFLFATDNDLGGETEQPRNGESGWIRGVELALQRQLGFGFGIYGNYTYTDSEAELPGGRLARLQGQADHVFNTALSLDRGAFASQLSLNYHDDYLNEYGGDEGDPDERFEDVFVDTHLQLDASVSYRVADRATLFLELVNLTNEPFRAFQGVSERPIQLEYYEQWGRLGIRYTW
jgi:TonB-dependent receptor